MIAIDRASNIPVHDQLTKQLRYQIASGRFQVDETLPSTRALAKQVGVSFHTVRKAYQELEREGLLEARVGSGYTVIERTPLGKSERIERGAAVVQDALQRLVALGLSEPEVEYLFQEQFEQLQHRQLSRKVLFAAEHLELADVLATQLTEALQHRVAPSTLAGLDRHRDAEYVLSHYADLGVARTQCPRADVLGVATYLKPAALEALSRLRDTQTAGLVCQSADTIPVLSSRLRADAGFGGPMLGAPIDAGSKQLGGLVEQVDVLLYTPGCRRRLLPFLDSNQRHAAVHLVVSAESITALREQLPS